MSAEVKDVRNGAANGRPEACEPPLRRSAGVLRSAAAAAVTGAAAVSMGGAARATLTAGRLSVDEMVAGAVISAGALAAAFLALGSLLLLTGAVVRSLGGASGRLEVMAARVTPVVLRRAVAVTVSAGLGLAVTAGPATAVDDVDLGWTVTATTAADVVVLQGADASAVPVPVGAPSAPAVVPSARPTPVATADPVPATVTVEAGDSLWSIAREHLPPDADDAEVAAAWPLWYAANRDVLGGDPDLIHPGQPLVAPADGVGGASQ